MNNSTTSITKTERAPNSGKLAGKTAIVTGGARGIGLAIASTFASEGAAVAIVSRTKDELEQAACGLRNQGARVLAVVADIASAGEVRRAVDGVLETFGAVDILVNNAAVLGPTGPLLENAEEEWIRTILINLAGTFLCTKSVLPHMIARGGGKIINLSGGGAAAPRPNFSAYAASKAAVVRLTETLAEEVRPHGIQVNAIAPGAVNTRMLEAVLAAGERAGSEFLQAQQHKESGGTPGRLAAELALFLASGQSGGLTGKLISAPHDDWRNWPAKDMDGLLAASWFTLRRVDKNTLGPLTPLIEMRGKACG